MSANPPHASAPGESAPIDRTDDTTGALSGGTHGILAVTMATLALALTAASVAAVIAWLV